MERAGLDTGQANSTPELPARMHTLNHTGVFPPTMRHVSVLPLTEQGLGFSLSYPPLYLKKQNNHEMYSQNYPVSFWPSFVPWLMSVTSSPSHHSASTPIMYN